MPDYGNIVLHICIMKTREGKPNYSLMSTLQLQQEIKALEKSILVNRRSARVQKNRWTEKSEIEDTPEMTLKDLLFKYEFEALVPLNVFFGKNDNSSHDIHLLVICSR